MKNKRKARILERRLKRLQGRISQLYVKKAMGDVSTIVHERELDMMLKRQEFLEIELKRLSE